jgi:DNA polymerase-3 subunit delta
VVGVAEALLPLYLICGTDRPKVLRATARLRARVESEGGTIEPYDAAGSPGQAVAGACAQLGLFDGPRLVLVTGVEAWKADDVTAIGHVAAAPGSGTTVALVAGPTLRADHRLRALVTGKALLEFAAPTARELPDFVRKEAARCGGRFEPEAVRRLIELVGSDAMALEREVDKLATYAAGAPIDQQMVQLLAFRGDDVSPFALQDAVSGRRRAAAARALVEAEAAGEKPHAMVPQIARHVDLLRRARRTSAHGGGSAALAKAAGVHPFRAQKALEAAGAWPERDAAALVVALARADHAMKGGERIDPQLAFERAVLDGL